MLFSFSLLFSSLNSIQFFLLTNFVQLIKPHLTGEAGFSSLIKYIDRNRRKKMKQFSIQNVVVPSHDEINVVCPKPRRPGLFNFAANDHPVRPFRWHLSCQIEPCDSNSSGSNPLDNLLTKDGDFDVEQPWPVSAPFFCGSPPSRVANPLIQDARFENENCSPISPPSWVVVPAQSGLPPSPSSSARKGGCVRANFGNNPAVRVEGFDCLDRDRRNCSIPALA